MLSAVKLMLHSTNTAFFGSSFGVGLPLEEELMLHSTSTAFFGSAFVGLLLELCCGLAVGYMFLASCWSYVVGLPWELCCWLAVGAMLLASC